MSEFAPTQLQAAQTVTQMYSRQRLQAISERYCWQREDMRAGRMRWVRRAQRIWMKLQRNGFASPSFSFPPEDGWVKMAVKNMSAYSERHCVIDTKEHKQSWINCSKHKMWFLRIYSFDMSAQAQGFPFCLAAQSFPAPFLTAAGKVIPASKLKMPSSFLQFEARR